MGKEAVAVQRALEQSLLDEQDRERRQAVLEKTGGSLAACASGCGWTAFPGHATCCRACKGSEGPHAADCSTKNRRAAPLCVRGCGRPAFASFDTCCTRCTGPDGPHTRDCAGKKGCGAGASSPMSMPKPPTAGAEAMTTPKSPAGPRTPTPKDVEESLRLRLAEWA